MSRRTCPLARMPFPISSARALCECKSGMHPHVQALMILRGVDELGTTTVVSKQKAQAFCAAARADEPLGVVAIEYSSVGSPGSERLPKPDIRTCGCWSRRPGADPLFCASRCCCRGVKSGRLPRSARSTASRIRLSHRHRRLSMRRVQHNRIYVAVAEEMTAGSRDQPTRHIFRLGMLTGTPWPRDCRTHTSDQDEAHHRTTELSRLSPAATVKKGSITPDECSP